MCWLFLTQTIILKITGIVLSTTKTHPTLVPYSCYSGSALDDARTTAAGDAAAMGSALADARAEAHRLSVELAGEECDLYHFSLSTDGNILSLWSG